MKTRRLFTLSFLLIAALPAAAHFVWVERAPDHTVAAWFGEWSADVRETQEGYLKLIAAPKAFAADGAPLAVKILQDRIAIAAPNNAGEIRLENRYFPEKGERLIHYQARLGRTQTAAVLPLELVPLAPGSNTFSLVLRGQPVADADVTLFTASGWNRTFKTDADGRVTIETPWPGQAVLEAAHVEETAGEHEGRAYTSVRHVATLTFTVSVR